MANQQQLNPNYADTLVNGTFEFYETTMDLLNVFENNLNFIKFNLENEKAKTSNDIFNNIVKLYVNLNNDDFKYDDTDFNNNFKLYILEKFDGLFDSIKIKIKGDTESDKHNIYQNFTEDIGYTLDIQNRVDISNTPFYDIFYSTTEVPNYIPTTIFNKTSQNTKNISTKLALHNDASFKKCLINIAGYADPDLSYTSHGYNLMYDSFYNNVFDQIKDIKTTKIVSNFGIVLGDVITFYRNLNVRQQPEVESKFFTFRAKIEEIENILDIMNINSTSTAYTNNTPLFG
tara:strand:- start:445 stop:1308 length:864 start_codon:yes stop_codon:yes gene_type:complete